MSGMFLALAASSLLFPAWARADATITEESSRIDGSEPATMRIYLTPGHVRVDSMAEGERQALVFDADRELFWMVDYEQEIYTELTVADLERMAARMRQTMEEFEAQIQAQLQGLPEAQRETLEEAIRAQMPPETLANIEYRYVGSGEPIGDWSADHYEGFQDGARVWDIWTVDWTEAGISESDFAVFERMGTIMEEASGVGGYDDFIPVGGEDGDLSGLPVRRVLFVDGEPDTRFQITGISAEPIDPTVFAVPEGFSEQALPPF